MKFTPSERAKRAYQIAKKRAQASKDGAALHADMMRAVESEEINPTIVPATAALLAVLGGQDFFAGFISAECQKRALAAQLKKGKR